MELVDEFFKENSEESYKVFSAKLCPNLKVDEFIGVRIPLIRKFEKTLSQIEKEEFLKELPHKYQEENLLHGFIIQNTRDFGLALKRICTFLPYITNWAVCDTITPKCFKKHRKELDSYLKEWIKSGETYKQRFAIVTMKSLFLDEYFESSDIELILSCKNEDYYLKMAVAWYLAEGFAKQYDKTLEAFTSYSIDKWTYNKAIQKAIESFRISKETKEYLRSLRK